MKAIVGTWRFDIEKNANRRWVKIKGWGKPGSKGIEKKLKEGEMKEKQTRMKGKEEKG